MAATMTPFRYDGAPPPEYVCTNCGAHGVRLYREYQTFARCTELTCTHCTETPERKYDPDMPHSIGWRVAAVPTEEGDTFWGYTSVPSAGVAWWNNLPLTAAQS